MVYGGSKHLKPKRISVVAEECSGCRTCELVCTIRHYKSNNPRKAAIRVAALFPEPGLNSPSVCKQCEDAPCVAACPVEAMSVDDLGVVTISPEKCIKCLACVRACPWGAIYTHDDIPTPILCDLCGYSKDSSIIPECVRWCPKKALLFEPATTMGDSKRVAHAKQVAHV